MNTDSPHLTPSIDWTGHTASGPEPHTAADDEPHATAESNTETATEKVVTDVVFLKHELKSLRRFYMNAEELGPSDIIFSTEPPSDVSPTMERCARIADRNGFDGSVFRQLELPSENRSIAYTKMMSALRNYIDLLPRIIATIEENDSTPVGAKLAPKSIDAPDSNNIFTGDSENGMRSPPRYLLKSTHIAVLKFLFVQPIPRSRAKVATAADISERATTDVLQNLIANDLVNCPNGKRSGYAITSKGVDCYKEIERAEKLQQGSVNGKKAN